MFQEYEEEISSLSSELASARDQNGVFLSTEKYQALMDQMNRQKIAIDQEKVKKCLISSSAYQGYDISGGCSRA